MAFPYRASRGSAHLAPERGKKIIAGRTGVLMSAQPSRPGDGHAGRAAVRRTSPPKTKKKLPPDEPGFRPRRNHRAPESVMAFPRRTSRGSAHLAPENEKKHLPPDELGFRYRRGNRAPETATPGEPRFGAPRPRKRTKKHPPNEPGFLPRRNHRVPERGVALS